MRQKSIISIVGLIVFSSQVLAVDTQAGDFITPQLSPDTPDLKMLGVYYIHNKTSAPASADAAGSRLDVSLAVMRGVYWHRVGGMLSSLQLIQPFGAFSKANIGPLSGGSEGGQLGDTSFLASIVPVEDHARGRILAVVGQLNMPTGSFRSDRTLNLGENRWSGTLQMGGIYRITKKYTLEVVGDVTFYGTNNNMGGVGLGMKQSATYQSQFWVNRDIGAGAMASIGYSYTRNGDKKLGGVSLNNNRDEHRARVSYSQMVGDGYQLLGELNRDLPVDHGMKREFGMVIRLIKVF